MRGWNVRIRWPCRGLLALLLLLAAVPAGATAPAAAGVTEFRRQQWSIEAGAPADIWALAQGEDGYLWLGTGNGLYRFDGVRFERFEPLPGEAFHSNDITALKMLADGSLWIGFYYGGASLKRNGHLVHFTPGKDLPDGMVYTFAQADDGSVWAATDDGLARYDGQRWHTVGADWGYPTRHADWVTLGKDGTLWVTTGEGLVYLRRGSHRFEPTDQRTYRNSVIAQAPDGTLWLSDHDHGTRALPGLDADHPRLRATMAPENDYGWSYRLLFDRYGNLWTTGVDQGGIYRIADYPRVAHGASLQPGDITEQIDRGSGLLTNRAVPLLQDREGTIWAGTNMGLVSFHHNSVKVPADIPQGDAAHYAIAMDAQGVPWIANHGALWRITPQAVVKVRTDLRDVNGALFDRTGNLWMTGRHDVFLLHEGTVLTVPFPPDVTFLSAFVLDGNDEPWLAFTGHGLYRLHERQYIAETPSPALAGRTPTAMARDGRGHLWLGYQGNVLAEVDGTRVNVYTSTDGLHVGHVTVVKPLDDETLIGGELGLARLRDGHIQSIVMAGNEAFSGITGIVRQANGDLWLNAAKGVVRISAAEAETAFGQPTYRPAYRVFDYADGLPGIALQAAVTPSALTDASNGNLWFLTNQGPAWIQPNDLGDNTQPPPVHILGLVANGLHYALQPAPRLPKGTDSVQIRYTATSLAIPERVRFRYRLQGVDAGWQDAGPRRDVFYANLRPGHYRFRVIAANDDGVWNHQGAELDFAIAPRFYQTIWFGIACALALIALLLTLFTWRMRLASERVHLQLSERMSERERIARDIHDTLLQGMQGLLLRLQALLSRMPPDDCAAPGLKDAIAQTRQMVIEGRDKIVSLRGDGQDHTELEQSLLAVGEDLAAIHPASFRLASRGRPRPILPSAFDEILDIVREGIRNAFVHAQASQVEVLVEYRRRQLRISVTDDGAGIDEATLRDATERGHWGVVGMAERAAKLRGRLALHPVEPRGTRLVLAVPCRAAYRAPARRRRILGRRAAP